MPRTEVSAVPRLQLRLPRGGVHRMRALGVGPRWQVRTNLITISLQGEDMMDLVIYRTQIFSIIGSNFSELPVLPVFELPFQYLIFQCDQRIKAFVDITD